MIYNSNGNNAPYQTGGNAKVNKQLKALEEAINNVSGALTNYETSNDSAVQALQGNVTGLQNTSVSDGRRIDALELTVNDLPVKVQTVDVKAEKGDFHAILNGKYIFRNGYRTESNAYICKLTKGSVVWATDGTNGVLVDYTDSDAWVAKAHVAENKKFTISENGVLMFSEASSFSVYVIGNLFDITVEAEGDKTDILTGITIGGTLYAALARDYDFNKVNIDNLTIKDKLKLDDNATFTSTNATIDNLHTDHITSGDIIVDDASVKSLVAAKRNIKDGLNSSIVIDAHPTTDKVFIGVSKFTGTYSLRLDKVIDNVNQTLFTATIVWNGKNPIVNYWENQSIATRDYLYSITLTDDRLYFCTQGDGTLYYAYDAMSDASAPMTFPSMPEPQDDVICEYITAYEERTVFLGNHRQEPGVDILGELNADIIHFPEGISAENMALDGWLEVGGEATFHDKVNIKGDTKAKNVEAEELYGTILGINDTGTKTNYEHNYLSASASGVNINVNTTINGSLTQTGNQDITGDVKLNGDLTQTGDQTVDGNISVTGNGAFDGTLTVKDASTLGDFQSSGSYTSVKYIKLNSVYYSLDSNGDATAITPEGTYISSDAVDNNVHFYSNALYKNNGQERLSKNYQGFYWNKKMYCVDTSLGYVEGTASDFYIIKDNPSTSILFKGFYTGDTPADASLEPYTFYINISGTWCRYRGIGIDGTVTKSDTLSYLNSLSLSSLSYTYEVIYNSVDYKKLLSVNNGLVTYDSKISHVTRKTDGLYSADDYVLYEDTYHVPKADPGATYDSSYEVLTVKGNERVIRDLKIQGNIFGDTYHTAFLPNVTSNETNTKNITATGNATIGGVLTVGDLD